MEKKKLTNEENLFLIASSKTEIFKAKYNGEEVISKKISLESNDKVLSDFIKKREITLMSELCTQNIPNLVKFHGWIEEKSYIKIIMEYLQGSDLSNFIGDKITYHLSIKQKVKILLDIAEGLEFIHRNYVIYRDLKPQNILINRKITDDTLDFTAKIIDFGLSKRLRNLNEVDPENDENSTVAANSGTYKYFAPEQSSSDYDYKVDIYAFALIAFELFSEKSSYSDKVTKNLNKHNLIMQIKKGLRPNKHIKPLEGTPNEILEMCERNWKEDPEDRQTACELIDTMVEIYRKL